MEVGSSENPDVSVSESVFLCRGCSLTKQRFIFDHRGAKCRCAHSVIEVTLGRTDSTELERGYTGQRGQDEQNRRARKASVGTPGAGLGRSQMSLGGGLVTQ